MKQELLQFINDNVTSDKMLVTYETILDINNETEVLKVGSKIRRKYKIDNTYEYINSLVDDNLIMTLGDNGLKVQIREWIVLDK